MNKVISFSNYNDWKRIALRWEAAVSLKTESNWHSIRKLPASIMANDFWLKVYGLVSVVAVAQKLPNNVTEASLCELFLFFVCIIQLNLVHECKMVGKLWCLNQPMWIYFNSIYYCKYIYWSRWSICIFLRYMHIVQCTCLGHIQTNRAGGALVSNWARNSTRFVRIRGHQFCFCFSSFFCWVKMVDGFQTNREQLSQPVVYWILSGYCWVLSFFIPLQKLIKNNNNNRKKDE